MFYALPKEKAALVLFDSKHVTEAELTTFAFCFGEIKKLLLELDPYNGARPDGIFPLFFIKTANYLPPKIFAVICTLVKADVLVYVGKLETSHQFLILVAPCTNACPNYRPFTITHVLSKVFESLLAKHVNTFAEKNNLLPNLQFGFCKCLGACDALLIIINLVQKALDYGCKVCMVGLHFSAASDRVNCKVPVFKLRQLGSVALFIIS